jgi:hypothetical protein
VIEIKNQGVINFQGTYDEYLASQEEAALRVANG